MPLDASIIRKTNTIHNCLYEIATQESKEGNLNNGLIITLGINVLYCCMGLGYTLMGIYQSYYTGKNT